MRKVLVLIAFTLFSACLAGNAAAAQGLQGRLAITGRVGVVIPADGERGVAGVGNVVVDTDAGIIGGGGLLFGVNDDIAAELDVTRSSYDASVFGTAEVTNISIGAQYRFPEHQRLIPYAGAGLDVLITDLPRATTETVLGLHLSAGVDYMLLHQVALNAEVKAVGAYNSDVRNFSGVKVGEFDPSNVAVTVGARFFFN